MIKKKMAGTSGPERSERMLELYVLGLNTLQALMYLTRLQREWEDVTSKQYALDSNFDGTAKSSKNLNFDVEPDALIKLLIRCKKMYEATTLIQKLIKMIM